MDMHTDTTAHLDADVEISARAAADMAAALAGPTDLAAIVAAAEAYDAEFVQPANARHNAADAANTGPGKNPDAEAAEQKAWKEWDDHCDAYRAIVDTILDHKPATPGELVAQVDAWGALTTKHFSWRPGAESLIGKLCETDAIMIGEHMHASLKRMAGGDGVPTEPAPTVPNTPLGKSVALRDRLRAERRAVGDDHDTDMLEELEIAISRAEYAVFNAPAANAAEALWKHVENVMESEGLNDHASAVACLSETGGADLDVTAARGIYRDLARLAGREDAVITPPAFNPAAIEAIVAEAREIAKDIGPAQDAFHAANEAWTETRGQGEDGLLARQNELESIWWGHLNRFSETTERLFDLPAQTTTDKALIVRTYAELMAPVFGDTELDNKLAGLPTENLLEVISYLDGTRPKALNGRDEIREAWINARLAHLEQRIDQAIADVPNLRGKHGLSDEAWLERFNFGEDAVREIAELDGDSALVQRLRIKALGWRNDYPADVHIEATGDVGERLQAAMFRSACKVAA